MCFSVVQGNGAESSVLALARVVTITLAEVETASYVEGVDSEDNWPRGLVVKRSQCRRG